MNDPKRCPFCTCKDWVSIDADHYRCAFCGAVVSFAFLDSHPIEDKLHKQVEELETEKTYLKSIIAGKDQTISEMAIELADRGER